MKYYKYYRVYKDGSENAWWFVGGKYKIVHYDYRQNGGCTEKRSTYHAYYIPEWFDTWGNHINKNSPAYNSFEDALQACHDFDDKHGNQAKFKKAA